MSEKSTKIASNNKQNKAENIDKNIIIIKDNNNENQNNINLSENMDTNEEEFEDSMDENEFENDNQQNVSEEENSKSIESNNSNELSMNRNMNRSNELKDKYCWDCHKEDITHSCRACPRSYHQKCPSLKNKLKTNSLNEEIKEFLCAVCEDIVRLEEANTGSQSMSSHKIDVNYLSKLLKYTIITVKAADKSHKFSIAVSNKKYPEYHNFIVNPMDLSIIEKNVKKGIYGSTNSFLADVKWIYHNCVIFNSNSGTAFISEAKNIIRVAKQECEEIEICPDCYRNYYFLEEFDYFAATCRRPHAIVWAKLSGHPYWPAKVVRYDSYKNLIDVRFFGTHDKCWLKPENCYFMSKEYPYNKKPSKFDETKFNEAIRDMNSHLDNLEIENPGLFKFYDKNIHFTVDKIFLTKTNDNMNDKSIECYNGIKMRKLTVNALQFNIRDEIKKISSQENDHLIGPKPPKKLKRSISSNSSTDSPKFNTNRCYSKSLTVRQAMNSSIESFITTEKSMSDEKIDSEVERSVNNDFESDQNSDEINDISREDSFENNSTQMNSENTELSNELKLNTYSTHSKTFTVMGNTPKTLHINRTDKSINNQTNSEARNGIFQRNIRSEKSDETDNRRKFKPKKSYEMTNNSSNDTLKAKIRKLEIKNRQLKEKTTKLELEVIALKDDKQELNYKLTEFEKSVDDIKRKQWCNNCYKEAILPCCWNTCYCTVQCQHQHWPIHAKSCRRKQMTTHQNK